MRVIPAGAMLLIAGLLLTGCGASQSSASKAQSYIVSGCKDFNSAPAKGKYLTTFSKLAILDPRYLELAKSAYQVSSLDLKQKPTKEMLDSYIEAISLLAGLCESVK
jgi:hypothetical protein